MDKKEKLLSDLEVYSMFILETTELHKELETNQTELHRLESKMKSSKERLEAAKLTKMEEENGNFDGMTVSEFSSTLFAAAMIGIAGIGCLWILEFILYLLTDDLYRMLLGILTSGGFYVIAIVLVVVGALIYYNNENDRDTIKTTVKNQINAEYQAAEEEYQSCIKRIAQVESAISNEKVQLQAYMQSEIGTLAQKVIPPDYFYPAAVEKFIYFLRNGHADTMKEAVKEYDEYMHRITLEYEAQLQRENSEKAAAYAKASAVVASDMAKAAAMSSQANAEMVQMAREIKEKQESIKFWTLYNGSLLEDIKNGRR